MLEEPVVGSCVTRFLVGSINPSGTANISDDESDTNITTNVSATNDELDIEKPQINKNVKIPGRVSKECPFDWPNLCSLAVKEHVHIQTHTHT